MKPSKMPCAAGAPRSMVQYPGQQGQPGQQLYPGIFGWVNTDRGLRPVGRDYQGPLVFPPGTTIEMVKQLHAQRKAARAEQARQAQAAAQQAAAPAQVSGLINTSADALVCDAEDKLKAELTINTKQDKGC